MYLLFLCLLFSLGEIKLAAEGSFKHPNPEPDCLTADDLIFYFDHSNNYYEYNGCLLPARDSISLNLVSLDTISEYYFEFDDFADTIDINPYAIIQFPVPYMGFYIYYYPSGQPACIDSIYYDACCDDIHRPFLHASLDYNHPDTLTICNLEALELSTGNICINPEEFADCGSTELGIAISTGFPFNPFSIVAFDPINLCEGDSVGTFPPNILSPDLIYSYDLVRHVPSIGGQPDMYYPYSEYNSEEPNTFYLPGIISTLSQDLIAIGLECNEICPVYTYSYTLSCEPADLSDCTEFYQPYSMQISLSGPPAQEYDIYESDNIISGIADSLGVLAFTLQRDAGSLDTTLIISPVNLLSCDAEISINTSSCIVETYFSVHGASLASTESLCAGDSLRISPEYLCANPLDLSHCEDGNFSYVLSSSLPVTLENTIIVDPINLCNGDSTALFLPDQMNGYDHFYVSFGYFNQDEFNTHSTTEVFRDTSTIDFMPEELYSSCDYIVEFICPFVSCNWNGEILDTIFDHQFSSGTNYLEATLASGCIMRENFEVFLSCPVSHLFSNYAVYPNPVTDYIYISGLGKEPVHIAFYDIAGKKIKNEFIVPGELLSVSDFTAGMYLLEIVSSSEKWVSRLIIR